MTKLISVILFLTFAVFCFADLGEDLKALERKLITISDNCMNKTGITEAQLFTLVRNKQIPEEKGPQCFLACMGKSFNIMNASNQFNKGDIDKLIEPIVKKSKIEEQEEISNKIIEVIHKCVDEQPDEKDECLAAKKAAQCLLTNAKNI